MRVTLGRLMSESSEKRVIEIKLLWEIYSRRGIVGWLLYDSMRGTVGNLLWQIKCRRGSVDKS